MKKINIESFLANFKSEISQAKANSFEALIIPFDDYDVYPFDNINDEDFIYEIADDFGWERFVVINLLNNKNQIIDLSFDAA